jgi:citrate lyase subunit beta/citryl-CoA lyase
MVRLPKTDSKEDIHELEAQVERIERECGREVGSTKLMAAIESALGVVNAVEIARASPRLSAIALAAFDYVMDMGTSRGDGTELFLRPLRGAARGARRRDRGVRRGVVGY